MSAQPLCCLFCESSITITIVRPNLYYGECKKCGITRSLTQFEKLLYNYNHGNIMSTTTNYNTDNQQFKKEVDKLCEKFTVGVTMNNATSFVTISDDDTMSIDTDTYN
jgi:hypothetical protein